MSAINSIEHVGTLRASLVSKQQAVFLCTVIGSELKDAVEGHLIIIAVLRELRDLRELPHCAIASRKLFEILLRAVVDSLGHEV